MPPLIPLQPFTLVYQLGNPGDNAAYFVRAIVRNSTSGATVATLNLVNQGNQRFTGVFTVPADLSGLGYYLDITYTVYTDSGYSTLSQNYPIYNTVAQVITPINTAAIGGGDGGIDETVLRKVFEEYLTKTIKGIPEYKQTEIDFAPLHDRIDVLERTLMPQEVDFSPLLSSVAEVKKQIFNLPKPVEPKEVDLYPVIEGIQNIAVQFERLEDVLDRIVRLYEGHEGSSKQRIDTLTDSIREEVKRTISDLKNEVFQIHVTPQEKKVEDKKEEPKIDKRIASLFPKRIKSPYVK